MDVLDENGLPIAGGRAFVSHTFDHEALIVGQRLEERRVQSTEAVGLIAEWEAGRLVGEAFASALSNSFFAAYVEKQSKAAT
jgi:hypothetical protein